MAIMDIKRDNCACNHVKCSRTKAFVKEGRTEKMSGRRRKKQKVFNVSSPASCTSFIVL